MSRPVGGRSAGELEEMMDLVELLGLVALALAWWSWWSSGLLAQLQVPHHQGGRPYLGQGGTPPASGSRAWRSQPPR